MHRRIPLPAPVTAIYRAVEQLRAEYPQRKFTPDGHLVGHLGEVIAAKEFGLTLLRDAHPGHDATDPSGRLVQIKLTAGKSISMYADCDRLIIMKIASPKWADVIYDDDGASVWAIAGKPQKNGQRSVRLSKLPKCSAPPAPAARRA
jgi:Family of unknown function (DUF6998)